MRVLMNMGIPAYSTSKTGYFSALEVVTVLNYLHICDNPMQEIPFTAVLASPMGASVRRNWPGSGENFPDRRCNLAAESYSREGTDDELREKLERFFAVYGRIRRRVPDTPIHQLIHLILQETATACMPRLCRGESSGRPIWKCWRKRPWSLRRPATGDFSISSAISKIFRIPGGFGEVSTIGENEDTVRIMSIHKSKGLEFPVVFVSGLGKRFNMTDANAGLVIHPDLGVGCNAIRPGLRIKAPSLMRQVIQKQLKLESLGEELRVLYVALTRAKERLILTGTVEKLDQKAGQWHRLTDSPRSGCPTGFWRAPHPSGDGFFRRWPAIRLLTLSGSGSAGHRIRCISAGRMKRSLRSAVCGEPPRPRKS